MLTVRADKLAFAVGAKAAHLVWKDQSGAETTVKAIASSGNLALSADGRLVLTREGRAMVLHDLVSTASENGPYVDSGGR